MAAKIIQNLILLLIHCLMYLGIFVGVLCWSLFYYASLCVLAIFVNTLTRKRMIVALLKLSAWCLVFCKCSVPLPHDAVG